MSEPAIPGPTRALDRGLRLLALLAATPQGLAFGVLRTRLALADSSLARLLHGLAASGHVAAAADGRWRVGPVWQELVGQRSWTERATAVARPILAHLVEATCCTGLLIAWTGRHMVVLERILHEDSVPLQAPGRVSDNLRHSPWGWLFASRERLLALPERHEAASAEEITAALDALPELGWTCRRQADRVRFAAPLRDASGAVRGALALGGLPTALPVRRAPEIGSAVAAAAASVEDLLRS